MTTRFDDTAPSVDELNGALKEAARGYVTTDNGFSPEIDSILSRCARAGVVSAADKKEAHRLHQQMEDEQAVSESRDAGWGVGNQS